MGNCNFKTEGLEKTSTFSVNNFTFHYVVGRGGFGKVWRVEQKRTKLIYAMKEMSKSRVISKKSVNSVLNERQLLSFLKHPFIVNMIYAFQDRENLYLIMDLMTGGDLRYHLALKRTFTEEQTKFFVACIFIALEFLHTNSILHRDIKPENLVFDSKGYLRLTDFGIARVWRPDNSNDTSGTPGYMAPEVMCRQTHGVAVDYYAIGVIAYECMLGRRPYIGRNRKEIRDQILSKQVQIKRNEIPDGWSLEATDFINKVIGEFLAKNNIFNKKLIQRKPVNRLGLDGPHELKNHPWLKDYPWEKLYNKQIQPPFVPEVMKEEFDPKNNVGGVSNNFEEENPDLIKQNAILLRRNSIQSLFNGYNYDMTLNVLTTSNSALSSARKSSGRQSLSSILEAR